MARRKISIATVFSGIGSPEQALERLGVPHEIVFACDNGERELKIEEEKIREILKETPPAEKEKTIVALYNKVGENMMEKIYKRNYKINDDKFFQDIRFLDGQQFAGQIDIMIGGSPCQAFSCNGKRGGFNDTRGTLFYEYARIIQEAQPKTFIFENVKGLLTHDKGRTWAIIKNVFSELNYDIHIRKDEKGEESPVLNTCEYGMPQNRMRVYVIGIRHDLCPPSPFKFPEKEKLIHFVPDYLEDNVDAKYYLGEKGFKFVTTHPSRAKVGDRTMNGKDNNPGWIMNCQKANQQFNWNGDFIFEPLSYNHSKEVLEKAYIGEWNGIRGLIRKFTPRECLKLMGFPDSFKKDDNDNIAYRQSGNSMVVDTMSKLIKEIINTNIFNQ